MVLRWCARGFALLSIVTIAWSARAKSAPMEEDKFILVEGQGIMHVASLRENIKRVQAAWGDADRAGKDDWSVSPYVFYEYHEHGVLFTTNKDGTILSMTVYCDTGDKEPFHKTDLVWVNPSTVYQTFRGTTTQGLEFKDHLTPNDVYDTYGKPEIQVQIGVDYKQQQREGKPFIVGMGAGGFSINYPQERFSCAVFGEFVESCTISVDEY